MNDIMRYLQQKNKEMLAELKALVEQESPTKDKVLTDAIAASVAELFERLTGGRAEIIPNETYGNHVRGEWGFGEEQILLLGHFDTVWKQGILEEMPFRVEDGKAYGPGIFDMKGGLVQGIYALHALTAMKKPVQSRVVFLFTSDEEIGSPTSREWIEREAARSKCVFVLEPSASPHGALKTSRKGIGSFRLKTKGVPVHAGIDYERGRSAIEELSRQIIYLHGLTDLEAGSTVNVGVIKGGTAANVVAEEAEAEIDLRIQNEAEAKRMFELMLGAAPLQKDTSVEVTGGIRRPPMERTGQVAQLFEAARRIAKDRLQFELAETATGGASDANFTAPIAPTLDGLGAVGDGAHARHEHVIIHEMPVRSALVALLIEQFSKPGIKLLQRKEEVH